MRVLKGRGEFFINSVFSIFLSNDISFELKIVILYKQKLLNYHKFMYFTNKNIVICTD